MEFGGGRMKYNRMDLSLFLSKNMESFAFENYESLTKYIENDKLY